MTPLSNTFRAFSSARVVRVPPVQLAQRLRRGGTPVERHFVQRRGASEQLGGHPGGVHEVMVQ